MNKTRYGKKSRDGFTLLELIIVIAIIVVCTAILTPSTIFFVRGHNLKVDLAVAEAMDLDLKNHCARLGVDASTISGQEMRSILLGIGYSLVPTMDRWSFVYDLSTKDITVVEFNELSVSHTAYSPKDATHIYPFCYLLGKGDSVDEMALERFCNVRSQEDWTAFLALAANSNGLDVWLTYSPNTTLFLWQNSEETGFFTTADVIEKISYGDMVNKIPALSQEVKIAMDLSSQEFFLPLSTTAFENEEDRQYFIEV